MSLYEDGPAGLVVSQASPAASMAGDAAKVPPPSPPMFLAPPPKFAAPPPKFSAPAPKTVGMRPPVLSRKPLAGAGGANGGGKDATTTGANAATNASAHPEAAVGGVRGWYKDIKVPYDPAEPNEFEDWAREREAKRKAAALEESLKKKQARTRAMFFNKIAFPSLTQLTQHAFSDAPRPFLKQKTSICHAACPSLTQI